MICQRNIILIFISIAWRLYIMTWAIVLIIIVILIGIAGIATGIYELIKRNAGCGILGIFLGAIILFINVILIFSV